MFASYSGVLFDYERLPLLPDSRKGCHYGLTQASPARGANQLPTKKQRHKRLCFLLLFIMVERRDKVSQQLDGPVAFVRVSGLPEVV